MIRALDNIQPQTLIDTTVSLIAALVLGALIGYERQFHQRTAGLRTYVLVAIGAALFVDIAENLNGPDGGVRVISYVVSGIGFLGAGVIMREGGNVRGLNTAATLWASAAVGAGAGADLLLEAILGTVIVLTANTLLRPLAYRINQRPISSNIEAPLSIHVICSRSQQKIGMAALLRELTTAGYFARKITVHAFSESDIDIEATLPVTGINVAAMDALVSRITKDPMNGQAFWTANT